MEVAMLARLAVRGIVSLSMVLMVATLTGCANNFTHANRSREEGMTYYKEKAYGDAAGAFRNAIRQDPRDYRSHFYLGVSYDELKTHQQAFSSYRTALEVMSQLKQELYEPAFRQMAIDAYATSIARYDDQELELNRVEDRAKLGQKAEDWFILAKIYRLRGDADAAMDAYRRAARWDVNDFHSRKEFGLYLLDPLGQTKDAEYWLRQAYRLDPTDDAVNAGLSRLGVTPLPQVPREPQQVKGPPRSSGGFVQAPRD
jgi:Tfp pilus assembly protein PilF